MSDTKRWWIRGFLLPAWYTPEGRQEIERTLELEGVHAIDYCERADDGKLDILVERITKGPVASGA